MDPTNRGEVTLLLQRMSGDDPKAASELLPVVYEELRRLARGEMANEKMGLTLQPTALVHEAYLRLIGAEGQGQEEASWQNRAHFFGAAAIAMRRILVERARSVGRLKRGGGRQRVEMEDDIAQTSDERGEADLLALDEALSRFEEADPRRAKVVMLKYFAGLSLEQTAEALQVSVTTVKADWNYSKAWLHRKMSAEDGVGQGKGGAGHG